MKKMIQLLLVLVAIPIIYVVGNILFATLTNFTPEEKLTVDVRNSVKATPTDSTFTFMTWNIGYAGLGDQENFFYDGGTMVRPSQDRSDENLKGIVATLKSKSNIDFLLVQEIDSNSKRTFFTNQYNVIADALAPAYCATYAMNYLVKYVPMPLEKPWDVMGKVTAGLSTFSKFQPAEVTRYQYPGAFPFPKNIYMLDRCMLVQHHKLSNGKYLVVINTHNSAFDNTGELKKQEMDYMRKYMLSEYEKGNYVVAGGDWNQNPPGFDYQTFIKGKNIDAPYVQTMVKADFMPADWKWAYDATTPTNRNVVYAYNPDKTYTTLIDFFLLSPNVQLDEVKGVPLAFKNSDHQPVTMKVTLKGTASAVTSAADTVKQQ